MTTTLPMATHPTLSPLWFLLLLLIVFWIFWANFFVVENFLACLKWEIFEKICKNFLEFVWKISVACFFCCFDLFLLRKKFLWNFFYHPIEKKVFAWSTPENFLFIFCPNFSSLYLKSFEILFGLLETLKKRYNI